MVGRGNNCCSQSDVLWGTSYRFHAILRYLSPSMNCLLPTPYVAPIQVKAIVWLYTDRPLVFATERKFIGHRFVLYSK